MTLLYWKVLRKYHKIVPANVSSIITLSHSRPFDQYSFVDITGRLLLWLILVLAIEDLLGQSRVHLIGIFSSVLYNTFFRSINVSLSRTVLDCMKLQFNHTLTQIWSQSVPPNKSRKQQIRHKMTIYYVLHFNTIKGSYASSMNRGPMRCSKNRWKNMSD